MHLIYYLFIIPVLSLFFSVGNNNGDDKTNGDNKENENNENKEKVILGRDGKPFDPERAMQTIDKLRAEEDAWKATKKERDELAAKLKTFEDAGKTAQEKLESDLQEANAKNQELEGKASKATLASRKKVIEAELKGACKSSGADFKVVSRLIDLSDIEFVNITDDDPVGDAKDLDKKIEALFKEFPYLTQKSNVGTLPNNNTNGNSTQLTEEQVRRHQREHTQKIKANF